MNENFDPYVPPELPKFLLEEDIKEYAITDLSWKHVRPLKDWLVIKADPRVKKTPGGIYLTEALTKIERVMEGIGAVMKAGTKCTDVKVGDRVVFRGFLKDASRDMLVREDDCDVFFLKEEDVLMVVDPGVELGAFSSPGRDEG